ncbi:MAG TPA: ATP-binding protein [Gemmatimonadaceae bacterium]|nr:ATP-binding protein [Gemmatimonadaceae bacterium]
MSASAHRVIPSPEPVSIAATAATRRRRTEQARELVGHGHSVQFYEDDRFLVDTVADFFAVGLVDGLGAVVIATREHVSAITNGLHEKGFDVERTCTNGQLTLLDAEELLASFMTGVLPDAGRFRRAMDGVLGSHARFGDGVRERRPVLAFNEMVDLLCREGNLDGAIRLEELWNELAESYTFSQLCAYSLATFSEDTHDAALRAICNQHAHVLPTERYMRVDEGSRLREIALLQQRALALETELQRRRHLEGELRDALRAAQAASRAKSDFLTVMSHELRTPLNAIAGHVQLMEMGLHGTLTDAQREALERVQRSQRHLLGMINDLLNLAEVDAGRVHYAISHQPVAPALRAVASLLAPLATQNGIAIAVRPPVVGDEALQVQADPEKLQQILLNLVTNAIKFSTHGGRITIEAGRCASDASLVEIRVHDTGVGMPPSQLISIFEPFVQLGVPVHGQRDGVGLGLSISRMLARGMGGELSAESEVGAGSTLTLALPLA